MVRLQQPKQQCKKHKRAENPVHGKFYLNLVETNPIELLKEDNTMRIGEWQIAQELWDTIRYLVDESGKDLLYVFTGSTLTDESKIMDSEAGRLKRIVVWR